MSDRFCYPQKDIARGSARGAICCDPHVMLVVVSIVNYLGTRKLKHRLFKLFLKEADSEYGNVVYQTDVRWFSRANALLQFIALKPEISKFLETEPKEFSKLSDSS